MPKIQPLHDKVLVERVESQEKTAGGIVLPDTAKEKPTEGRVVAVGRGRLTDEGERIPLSVRAGDRVLFGSFAGTAIRDGAKEYLILEEGDLLGIVDDAPWSAAGASRPESKSGPGRAEKSAKGPTPKGKK
jgi:chaperonin GroES